MDKIKVRPQWSPSEIKDIQDEDISEKFFSKYSPENGTAPAIVPPPYLSNVTDLADPMKFALPTEAEIRSMVDGSHRSSGATTITLDELLTMFDRMRNGKAGMREKILEVVDRKCFLEQDKHMDKKWVQWRQ